jgi:UDP-N-acetylmuramyl pentapeptide synthase
VTPNRPSARQLIRSQPGRLELRRRYTTRLWPVMSRVGRVYRMTLGRRPRVVAVIGSVGKTTTTRAVLTALGLPISRAALLNANSHAAIGRTILGIRPWQQRAVLEVGIGRPGEMRLQGGTVRPNIVVVTAIASDHWRSFHTLEATRHEKAEILRTLPGNGVAIVNADDPNVRWMATQTKARVILIGESPDAEIRATDIELDWPHGNRFVVHIGSESHLVSTRLVGRHMVFPALAAIAVAHVERVALDKAIEALATLSPTPGRMQTMALSNGAFALRDEFKASEDGFAAAFKTVAEIPAARRIAVIGEITEETGRQAYRDIGAQASAFVDRVIFVGSGKNLRTLRSGATSAGMKHDQIVHVRHSWEATALLQDDLQPGDVVFIKGRWQQALGRVGLELAGRDVRCRADPCPFKRMLCDICPFLEQDFHGLGVPGKTVTES